MVANLNVDTSWTAEVTVGSKDIRFKLDTGAEVTAITEDACASLQLTTLNHASKVLYGPGRSRLTVLGETIQRLTYQGKASDQQLFVMRGLTQNLLGLPAIRELNLICRVDALTTDAAIIEAYPTVFSGLGEFGEPYHITLSPNTKPHSLFTPRRVPFSLRSKVQEELNYMERIGVISKVTVPTEWCLGMVPVLKKSGAVRICVDLQRLNQSVLRKVHPLPRVEETLAQLSGARIFSRLNANSGFW